MRVWTSSSNVSGMPRPCVTCLRSSKTTHSDLLPPLEMWALAKIIEKILILPLNLRSPSHLGLRKRTPRDLSRSSHMVGKCRYFKNRQSTGLFHRPMGSKYSHERICRNRRTTGLGSCQESKASWWQVSIISRYRVQQRALLEIKFLNYTGASALTLIKALLAAALSNGLKIHL